MHQFFHWQKANNKHIANKTVPFVTFLESDRRISSCPHKKKKEKKNGKCNVHLPLKCCFLARSKPPFKSNASGVSGLLKSTSRTCILCSRIWLLDSSLAMSLRAAARPYVARGLFRFLERRLLNVSNASLGESWKTSKMIIGMCTTKAENL